MIEDCVLCGRTKPSNANLALCRECRFYALGLVDEASQKSRDAIFSEDLAEAAIVIVERYELGDFWGVVLDYLRLIVAGLKSEADLMGILVKEGRLKPDKAKALAREIVSLYFE
jgi:hypothetical protein